MASPTPHAGAHAVARSLAHELDELAAWGRRLGNSHPGLAQHLAREAQDPDVERLIEGTAFLCAQVRARTERCAPKMVGQLADLVAPWVQRDLPAAALIQITPDLATASAALVLPAGTAWQAPAQGSALYFQTTEPLTLLGVQATEQRWTPLGHGQVQLTVRLVTAPAMTYAALWEHGLRLHVTGPLEAAEGIALALMGPGTSAALHDERERLVAHGALEPRSPSEYYSLTPVFDDDPPMVGALGRLRDHMVLEAKAHTATVRFSGAAPTASPGEWFTLTLTLNKPIGRPVDLEMVRMRVNVVPVHNVVRTDAVPVRLQPARTSYPLRAQDAEQHQLIPMHVAQVETVAHPGAPCVPLWPQHRFAWSNPQESPGRGRYYTLEQPGQPGCPPTLHVHHAADQKPGLEPETLTAQVWCHQGAHAAGHATGALAFTAVRHPHLTAINVTGTSPWVVPPSEEARQFALLGLITQRGPAAPALEDLHRVLQLAQTAYDPASAAYRSQRRRETSLVALTTQTVPRLWQGVPVLSLHVELEINGNAFESLAGAYFFVDGLVDVWAQNLSAQSVFQVHMRCPHFGASLTWPLRSGDQTDGRLICALEDEAH